LSDREQGFSFFEVSSEYLNPVFVSEANLVGSWCRVVAFSSPKFQSTSTFYVSSSLHQNWLLLDMMVYGGTRRWLS
jgi:hypothetical protein